MRKYRTIISLLVILFLLSGGYFILIKSDSAVKTQKNEEIFDYKDRIQIVNRLLEDIVELRVEYLSEVFVIEKANTDSPSWILRNRDDFVPSDAALQSTVQNFCILKSDRLVDERIEDISKYGFSAAEAAKLTGRFSDGEIVTIEIGDQNSTGDGYYMRLENSPNIYLCNNYAAEKLRLTKILATDLRVFNNETQSLQRMKLERNGALVFTAEKKDESAWELIEPIKFKMRDDAYTQLSAAFLKLNAKAVEALNATDLSTYGLDKPRYKLSAATAYGTQTLLLGSEKEKDTTVYGLIDGTKDVIVLELKDLPFLDKPLKEIIDIFIYIVHIDQVDRITVSFDDQVIDCEVITDTENKENDAFFVNNVDVTALENNSNSYFRMFYQALISVISYDAEPEAIPAGRPEITFLYTLKTEPGRMKIEFIPKDDRLYYACINDVYSGVVVEKRRFDDPGGLRPAYQALKDAMEKGS